MALNIYVRVGESGVSTVMPLFRIFAENYKTTKIMALNIQAAMDLRGVTLSKLAKRMGIAVSTCHAIVHGNPVLSSLEAVAKALHCDVAELFDRPRAWQAGGHQEH